jgi:2-polyprenyl-6-methoxyphenol hydroxylase-like FAD-dependent oxidoreductase
MSVAMRSTAQRRDHAVVIGGSMAGLLAARVLADSFARVTLVERDRFPDGPAFRVGVPQSRHLHILLLRGRMLLEQFFPGIVAELRAAGAETVDWPRDMLWLSPGGWSERYAGISMLSASRELLEWRVRCRVAALPGMRFVERCDAVGLLPNADGTAVAGVRLRHRVGDAAAERAASEETLGADLVVDASGRDSQTPRWLQALGYPAPEQVTINPLMGYASRYYARPAELDLDWRGAVFSSTPATPRAAVLLPIEGNRWHVTVAGIGGDYPPTDEDGFLNFLRGLRSSLLYDVLHHAEPLSPVVGYRRTENQMRRYEQLARRPERLVVLGDAACAFNPIYGQGMTVAALAADLLGACLRERPAGDLNGLAARFQHKLASITELAWLMATGEDLRYSTTLGPRPSLATNLTHRYLDRVIAATTDTPAVGRAFLSVAHLVVAPSVLFSPRIAFAALASGRHEGLPVPPTRDFVPALSSRLYPSE